MVARSVAFDRATKGSSRVINTARDRGGDAVRSPNALPSIKESEFVVIRAASRANRSGGLVTNHY